MADISSSSGVSTLPPPPEYWEKRVALFEEARKNQPVIEPKAIKITLPDGKQVDGVAGVTTPFDIALSISKGLANASIAATVNGEVRDLFRPFEDDSTLALIKFDSPEGKKVFWHSSAHVLGQALERKYHSKLCIGPAIEEGFYYDSRLSEGQAVSDHDFEEINAIVKQIVDEKQKFERLVVTKEVALEMFAYNPYKTQIISQKVPDGGSCTVYRCGPLIDLCKGPHVLDTGKIQAFAVRKTGSAYWLGNAENDSLSRVYGISFPDNKQLKEYLKLKAEQEARDHRLIGQQQELFFFHPLSPGSCFFLPHGARIYNRLVSFLKAEYLQRGFSEVVTPNMYSIKLWEKSGHWQNYSENMFSFEVEKQLFALKPMNCPGHCLMFDHRARSYRELPLRLADFGVLHRNELSGALSGLTRVRRFQQDDAHIFCTEDMIKSEIKGCIDFFTYVYGIFGYNFTLELSTRPEKFIGDVEVWRKAEAALAESLNESGFPWKENPGDGAFYGPKIDIHIKDAIGRSHQCATIQLDFNLPERFNLEYTTDVEGERKRPVIIHRAILGSVERFLGILIEHTAGKWPFWLSPRQVMVVPIAEECNDYALKVKELIQKEEFYVDVDLSDEHMKNKIKKAQKSQYNFMLVIGKKEMEAGTVNVRTRDNVVHGTKPVDEVIREFKDLCKNHQ